jgi:DNA sulfur modification protein DndC
MENSGTAVYIDTNMTLDITPTLDDAALTRWRDVVRDMRAEYLDESQNFPWIIGFSGGKDSTLVVHAAVDVLTSLAPSRRSRPVHVVSNDTLVESPVVMAHLNKVTDAIKSMARSLGLPITVARTTPEVSKSFWVLLIGKGYPSPNQTMRWCTDRLKIQPTSDYIKQYVSLAGAAIVVLGVRRDESGTRQNSINKHQNLRDSNLSPHSSLLGALIYRPIVDLSTDDVWEILGTFPTPWGGTHTDLFQLYRDAEGGECPVVLSKEEAPGCGTPNSRFGCWTCTVVEKDKSLQGFIDVGNHQFKPLVEFRDWLKSIRNKSEHRQAFRRNGRLSFDLTGKHIPGPFTIQTRRIILERLLKVQEEFGEQLISPDELHLIYQHWNIDIQQEKGLADG